MSISSVSSSSSVFSLPAVSSTYSDEASLLSTKISDLQTRIKSLSETDDSSATDSSTKDTSTASQAQAAAQAVAAARAAKAARAAAASADEEETEASDEDEEDEGTTAGTLAQMQAQLTQYQIRQAQIQGLQVGESMEQQLSSINKYNSMASLTGQVLDITA